jgi:hypothetical protein
VSATVTLETAQNGIALKGYSILLAKSAAFASPEIDAQMHGCNHAIGADNEAQHASMREPSRYIGF